MESKNVVMRKKKTIGQIAEALENEIVDFDALLESWQANADSLVCFKLERFILHSHYSVF